MKINKKLTQLFCHQTFYQCEINAQHLVASLCGLKTLNHQTQFMIHKKFQPKLFDIDLQYLKKYEKSNCPTNYKFYRLEYSRRIEDFITLFEEWQSSLKKNFTVEKEYIRKSRGFENPFLLCLTSYSFI